MVHQHIGPLDVLLLLLVLPLSVLSVLLQSCLFDATLSRTLSPSIRRLVGLLVLLLFLFCDESALILVFNHGF